jgi:hypothetical protein
MGARAIDLAFTGRREALPNIQDIEGLAMSLNSGPSLMNNAKLRGGHSITVLDPPHPPCLWLQPFSRSTSPRLLSFALSRGLSLVHSDLFVCIQTVSFFNNLLSFGDSNTNSGLSKMTSMKGIELVLTPPGL